MAEVTAALVKELRDKTGAGMMDCKRALGETGGDMEAAVDWLRKKGLAAAAKKAGRVAAEGLIGVATRPRSAGAVVEVNSETDFVARNELFQAFVRTVAGLAVRRQRRCRGAEGDALSRHRAHCGRGADRAGRAHRREPGAAPGGAARGRNAASSPRTCTIRWLRASARSGCWWRSNPRLPARRSRRWAGSWRCMSPPPTRNILISRLGAGGGARPRTRRTARAGVRQRQVGGDRRAHGRGPAAQVL